MATRSLLPKGSQLSGESFDFGVSAARELERHDEGKQLVKRPLREYVDLVPEPNIGLLRIDNDFPFQAAWYEPEVTDAEEVVWMKSTQVGMCLAPWTRVLTADLRWVPIGEVAVGKELVSADEEAAQEGRKLRTAIVTAKWARKRRVRRIEFEDGRTLELTPEHRMLVQRGARPGSNMDWRAAEALKVGQRVRSVTLPPFTEADGDPFEDGWMAGLLDGEGCLRNRAAGAELVITQQPGAVLDRAIAYLTARGYAFGSRVQDNGVARITIGRSHDVLRLLAVTRPSRFDLTRWWQGVKLPGTYGHGAEKIVAIEDDAREVDVIDIETSTGTFIAEGFVSHNSAYSWRWAVRQSDQFGETGVYIFPTDTHVTEFGDERIEPAIQDSDYLQSRIPRGYVRHKRLKRIGRGFLHLRGSNSKAGAQSVAAQFIVFDEYDFLDPQNLPQIERRITGARQLGLTPRIRRLGTPTLDGHGISQAFEESDQRVWMVTCGDCGFEQPVSWEENVRWINEPGGAEMRPGTDDFDDPKHVERVWRCCARCEVDIDVKRGRWIAQRPARRTIGFHVPRLIVPYTDLKQIVVASRSRKPMDVEAFENNDLGRPYSASEAQLTQGDLLRACELGGELMHEYTGAYVTTAGIDVAGERALNMVVHEQLPAEAPHQPNPRRAVWIGRPENFEEALAVCKRFRCSAIAIDSNPERRMAKAFRAEFAPGVVVLVVYDHKNDADSIKLSEVGQKGTPIEGVPLKLTVNRTEVIDAMMEGIRTRRVRPLADPPPGYFDQMRALKRRTVLDTKGRPYREYITTGTAGDDYAHAEVYGLVATELLRMGHGVQSIAEAGRERALPDEQMGFRRVRLAGDHVDDYKPGFGE